MSESFFFKDSRRKGKLPRLPFRLIKNRILGEKYELSFAIISPSQSQKLNRTYRKINRPADVLSFALGPSSGEIVIDPKTAEKEALKFSRPIKNFLGFLFIHGLLHLKGLKHGRKMSRLEKKYCQEFAL